MQHRLEDSSQSTQAFDSTTEGVVFEDFETEVPGGAGPSTVIAALDQIEVLVEEARLVPLSANVILNKAEILDLVSLARQALPEDLVAANAVVADADAVMVRADSAAEAAMTEAGVKAKSVLEQAREKADTILAEASDEAARKIDRAKEDAEVTAARAKSEAESTLAAANAQVDRMVSTHHVTEVAQARARELVATSERESAALRTGADQYVVATLGSTSELLKDLLQRTEAGLNKVSRRQQTTEPGSFDLD